MKILPFGYVGTLRVFQRIYENASKKWGQL